MDAAEADLRILRGCARALGLDPTDALCPDLEAIANGDGTPREKVIRFKYQLMDNIRDRRQAGVSA